MNHTAVNLAQKFTQFSEHWSPKIVAQMHGHHFKLARFQNEFVWHSHAETDEVFIVIDEHMSIDFRGESVELKIGEMFVVPKGIEHKPVAEQECHVMLVEPAGTVITGDASGDLTADGNAWI